MKSGKITWIWSLSIAAAVFVILLQGYWLYNQYRFETEKASDETIRQTLSAWNEYHAERKKRLQFLKDNLKSYNTNLNQNSVLYLSQISENSNETEWTISIRALKNLGTMSLKPTDSVVSKKTEHFSLDILSEAQERLRAVRPEDLPENDTITAVGFEENVQETDSAVMGTFRFKTDMNQNAAYEAVSLFLTDVNQPFRPEGLDSLLQKNIGAAATRIDTLTLAPDSVLWEPKSEKILSFFRPSVTVHIPYNVLRRKVAQVSVPIVSARIIQTMAFQIAVSLLLMLVLVVCLALQIQTISRQQRIGKLRQNFVNTTLHELKRPVQTLKTIVSFLQTRESDAAEMLDDARAETDNLTAYLQKLREVNEAETITESLHLSYFDFSVLAKEVVDKMLKNTPKPLRVETRLPDAPLMATADKMAVEHIIVNLLENAVKYSDENPEIAFRAEKQGNLLVFSVSDNGIGIPPTEQHAIFEPFFRSKNPLVASLPGMGLGLSYVKMAVEAHRGNIAVASKPQKGTTFTIEIPQP